MQMCVCVFGDSISTVFEFTYCLITSYIKQIKTQNGFLIDFCRIMSVYRETKYTKKKEQAIETGNKENNL
jgi:hypothetical protein